MLGLGNVFASQGDKGEALRAWRRALVSQDMPDSTAAAAVNIATVATLEGDLGEAVVMLEVAAACGVSLATVFAATLSPDESILEDACRQLAEQAENTDAINFRGLAAYRTGDLQTATMYWTSSAGSGDVVAPLLLSLTDRTTNRGQ